MMYGLISHASRTCVRCQRDLVDAASLNEGIGPICRKLDNALLAKSFPSDAAKAFEEIDSVDLDALDPATVATFLEIRKALSDQWHGLDWRKPVKQMEWALSFPKTRKVAFHACVKATRALGYAGLAALWEGEASTGAAMVRCDSGRVYVKGPRNKSFRMKVREIKGFAFHGATSEWSVPAKSAYLFQSLVQTYYPNHVGLDAAVEAAAAHIASQPAAVQVPVSQPAVSAPAPAPAPAPAQPKVRMVQSGSWIQVFSPYSGNFVASVKAAFPYNDRKWDGAKRCWLVLATHRDALIGLIVRHYHEMPEMDLAEAKSAGGMQITPAPEPAVQAANLPF